MWQLAWRNLWRSRARTLITLSAVSLTLGMRFCQLGIAEDSYTKMRQAAAKAAGGDVVVMAQGYWKDRTLDESIPDGLELTDKIAHVPGVQAAIPRVLVTGLVSSARGNAGVMLTGVRPEDDAKLQDYRRYLSAGTFLEAQTAKLAPLVLGKALVDKLGVKLGKRVVFTATDAQGEVTRVAFRLTGILDTGSKSADATLALTTLEAAQRALRLGDAIIQVGVVHAPRVQRAALRDAIAREVDAKARGLEVMTWDEAMPEMVSVIELDASMGTAMNLVVFLVVCFGIANTFLMAVIERIRELGLLSALGMTPGRLGRLLVSEATLLAAVSIAIAWGVGLAGHAILQSHGLNMAEMSGKNLDVSGVIVTDLIIHSVLNPFTWGRDTLAVFLLVVLSSLYPAWRATRLEPAQAMRTYE